MRSNCGSRQPLQWRTCLERVGFIYNQLNMKTGDIIDLSVSFCSFYVRRLQGVRRKMSDGCLSYIKNSMLKQFCGNLFDIAHDGNAMLCKRKNLGIGSIFISNDTGNI